MSDKQIVQRIHCLEMWIEILTDVPNSDERITEYQTEIELLRSYLNE